MGAAVRGYELSAVHRKQTSNRYRCCTIPISSFQRALDLLSMSTPSASGYFWDKYKWNCSLPSYSSISLYAVLLPPPLLPPLPLKCHACVLCCSRDSANTKWQEHESSPSSSCHTIPSSFLYYSPFSWHNWILEAYWLKQALTIWNLNGTKLFFNTYFCCNINCNKKKKVIQPILVSKSRPMHCRIKRLHVQTHSIETN